MKHTDKVMTKKNKKPTINDLLEDMESMMDFVSNIGNKAKKIREETEKKYNPVIKKLKNNLDSLK